MHDLEHALALALVTLCLSGTACIYRPLIVNELQTPDSGTIADAGSTRDSGAALDGGTLADAGMIADAGAPLDAGMPLDAGSPADTGTSIDAGAGLRLPFAVDDHFPDRSVDGDGFMTVHVEDGACPMRAGGQVGDCHRIQWDASNAFTGSYWTVGADFEGLTAVAVEPGATGIRFYAWGRGGDEVIDVGAGIGAGFGPGFDGAEDRRTFTLTSTPTSYTVDFIALAGVAEIQGAFFWSAFADRNRAGFEIYIDDIQWVR